MALPKRRISRARGRRRRTHYVARTPAHSTCPHCQASKAPHVVCPHCGMYRGRQVLAIADDD